MAEGIVIEVTDGVAATIATKIRGIGTEARDANVHIERLRAAVALMGNADPVARLQSQINALNLAQQRLTTAATQGATATQRLQAAQTATATSAQRLATAQQQTATATSNAAAAAARAATAQAQLGAAQDRTAASSNSAGSAMGSFFGRFIAVATVIATAKALIGMADSYTVLQNKLGTVSTSLAQTNELTAAIFGIAQKTSVAVGDVATAFTRFDRALLPLGKSQAETLRMTETINKALLLGGVTAQEASGALLQLSQGFNAGRLQGDEFRSVAENMPSIIKAIAEVMKVGTGEVKKLGSEGKITSEIMFKATKLIEESTDVAFSKMQKTVGQASVNMKNSIVSFLGELDKSTGFTAAMANGTIKLAEGLDELSKSTMNGENGLVSFLKSIGELYSMIKQLNKNAVDTLSDAFSRMGGEGVKAADSFTLMEVISKVLIGGLKGLLIVGNEIIVFFGRIIDTVVTAKNLLVAFDRMEFASMGGIAQGLTDRSIAAREAAKSYRESVMLINNAPKFKDPRLLGAVDTIANQAKANGISNLRGPGRNTVKPEIEKGKKDDNKKKTPEEEFQLINKKYTDEIASLGMLKPWREDKLAMDQISLELLRKDIVLTKTGREELERKITALREGKVVQQELDRISESAIEPARTFNAIQTAANKLLAEGTITREKFNEEMFRAKNAYSAAIDPMYETNRQLTEEIRLAGIYGPQREIENRISAVNNDLRSKGTQLTELGTKALTAELTLLQKKNDLTSAQNALLSESVGKRKAFQDQMNGLTALSNNPDSGFTAGDRSMAMNSSLQALGINTEQLQIGIDAQLAQLQIYYQQVSAMRAANAAEAQAQSIGLAQIEVAQNALKFESTKGVLGALATLQTSHNQKIAAIGKAAAITEATIAGFLAVQKALASGPPPWNYIAAAAVGVSAAMNVAKIAGVKGFESGGYTGNGGRSAMAGVVHGQEFVMNAQATRRNRPQLEAMNAGAQAVNANDGGGSGGKPKIIMLTFDIDNNIQTSGGTSNDTEADSLKKAAETISRKTQSDIMDSIRMGGVWSKVIKQ